MDRYLELIGQDGAVVLVRMDSIDYYFCKRDYITLHLRNGDHLELQLDRTSLENILIGENISFKEEK